MGQFGGRLVALLSHLVIALAIAGVGLDALPATVLLGAPAWETLGDDGTDDVEDDADFAWPLIHVKRSRAVQFRGGASLKPFAPPETWRAMTRAAGAETSPRLSVLLCRFLC
jgi:hypothetical protein